MGGFSRISFWGYWIFYVTIQADYSMQKNTRTMAGAMYGVIGTGNRPPGLVLHGGVSWDGMMRVPVIKLVIRLSFAFSYDVKFLNLTASLGREVLNFRFLYWISKNLDRSALIPFFVPASESTI